MINLEGTWKGELDQRGNINQFLMEIIQQEGDISGTIKAKHGNALFVGTFDDETGVMRIGKEYYTGRSIGVIFMYEGVLNLSEKKISGKWFQATAPGNNGHFWIIPETGIIQVGEPRDVDEKKKGVICVYCNKSFPPERASYRKHACSSSTAKRLIRLLARYFSEQGEYNASIQVLEDLLAQDPKDINALYSLGNIFLDQGKHDKAREVFLNALELYPDNDVLLRSLSYSFDAAKDFVKSIKAGLASLEIDPNQPNLLNFLTYRQFTCNQKDEAIASARKVLALDPANENAKKNLKALTVKTDTFVVEAKLPGQSGTLVAKLKDGWRMAEGSLSFWDFILEKGMTPRLKAKQMVLNHDYLGAIPIYKDMVDKNPTNSEALRGLSYALLNLERYDEVRELLMPASMRNKIIEDEALIYYLCTTLEKLGEQRNALAIVKESMEVLSKSMVIEYLIGHLHMVIEPPEPQEAMPHLEKFLDHDPTVIQATFDLARAHAILGDMEDVFTLLRSIIGQDPESRAQIMVTTEFSGLVEDDRFKRLLLSPGYFLEEAKQCINEERYAAARDSLENAIEENPTSSESYMLLGNVYVKYGLLEQSFPLFEKVLDIKNDNLAAVSTYLDVLARIAHPDKKKAKFVINRFLRSDITSPSAWLVGPIDRIAPPEIQALKDLALLIDQPIKVNFDELGGVPGKKEPACVIRNDHVVELDLTGTRLCYVPPSIKDLAWLESLVLDDTRIRYINENIGYLRKLRELSVRSSLLSQIPQSIGQLTSLECLDLAMNEISWLPASLGTLKNLRILDISSNSLLYLPERLGELQNIKQLILGRNFYLLRLPESLKKSRLIDRMDTRDTSLPGAYPAPAGTFTRKKEKNISRRIGWLSKVDSNNIFQIAREERDLIQQLAKNTYLTEDAEFFEELVSDPKHLEIFDDMDVFALVNNTHLVRIFCMIEVPEKKIQPCELKFLKSFIYRTYFKYKRSGYWLQSIVMNNLEELEFSAKNNATAWIESEVLNALLSHLPNLEILRIADDRFDDKELIPISLSNAPNLEEFSISSKQYTLYKRSLFPDGLFDHQRLRSLSISVTEMELDLDKLADFQQLESLKITSPSITTIPEVIFALKNLKVFGLESRKLENISQRIGDLHELREIRLSGCFKTVPVELFNLKSLRCLELKSGYMEKIPDGLDQLTQLEELTIDCDMKDIPSAISGLCKLKLLVLRSRDVKALPSMFQNLKSLVELELGLSGLKNIESDELVLPYLKKLNLHVGDVRFHLFYLPLLKRLNTSMPLPNSIMWSEALEELRFDGTNLPSEIGYLKNLKLIIFSAYRANGLASTVRYLQDLQYLLLNECDLRQFPFALCGLENLRFIDLNHNSNLADLPGFYNLPHLVKLHLQKCKVAEIPDSFNNLISLEDFNAELNVIEKLPAAFSNLKNLKIFNIGANEVEALPESLRDSENVREILVAGNFIVYFPYELLNLKNLQKLGLSSNLIEEIDSINTDTILHKIEIEIDGNPVCLIPRTDKSKIQFLTQSMHRDFIGEKITEDEVMELARRYVAGETLKKDEMKLLSVNGKEAVFRFIESSIADPSHDPILRKIVTFAGILPTIGIDDEWLLGSQDIPVITEADWEKGAEGAVFEDGRVIKLCFNSIYHEKYMVNNTCPYIGYFEKMKHLKIFTKSSSKLQILPRTIKQLQSLEILEISSKRLHRLPDELSSLKNLQSLCLNECDFSEIPPVIFNLVSLREVSLSKNRIKSINANITALQDLVKLDLSENRIDFLSPESCSLPRLEEFFLQGNSIKHIPDEISGLEALKILDMKKNSIISISRALGKLTHLQKLDLSSNSILKLPDVLGELTELEMLDLSNNRLVSLSESIGALKNLVSLGLEGNNFTNLPETLGSLSSITSTIVSPALQIELYKATKKPELCYPYIIQLLNNPYEREKVKELIDFIMDSDPSIGAMWYFKGMYLAFNNQHADATAAFKKAFDLDPVLHTSRVAFAWAKYTIDLLLNLSFEEKATEAIQQFLETAPKELPLWDKLGELNERLGKYELALQAYEKTLSLYTVYTNYDEFALINRIGLLKQKMGDPAGARDYFKGLKYRIQEYGLTSLLGDTYLQEENSKKAIQTYLKALYDDDTIRVKTWTNLIKLLPDHKLPRLVRVITDLIISQEHKVKGKDDEYHVAGDALEERGFIDLAERYYRACLYSQHLSLEDNLICRIHFIWILKRSGQYAKARVECKKGLAQILLEAPGNNDTGLYNSGYLMYEMMDFTGAFDAFSRYTERYPTEVTGWGMLCASLIQLSRFQEAIQAAQKAKQMHKKRSDEGLTCMREGIATVLNGDPANGFALLKRAEELEWPRRELPMYIAISHAMMGEFDQAKDVVNRHGQVNVADKAAVAYMEACIAFFENKIDDAISFLEKTVELDPQMHFTIGRDNFFSSLADSNDFNDLMTHSKEIEESYNTFKIEDYSDDFSLPFKISMFEHLQRSKPGKKSRRRNLSLDVERIIDVPGGISENDEAIILDLQKYYNIPASIDGTTSFVIVVEKKRVVGLYIDQENDTAEMLHPHHVAFTCECIQQLDKVETLHISGSKKVDIKIICQLPSLHHLFISHSTLWNVREFSNLQSLKTLCLHEFRIMADEVAAEDDDAEKKTTKDMMPLLESICNLTSLIMLELENYPIEELPENLGNLENLLYLNLNNNGIAKLPESFSRLRALQTLKLRGQHLTSFPEQLLELTDLVTLDMGCDYGNKNLFTIPDKLDRYRQLQRLNLEQTTLAGIPPSMQDMPALIDLNLSRAAIQNADSCFTTMNCFPSLAKLNLHDIKIDNVPPVFERCTSLIDLNLSNCGLIEIPAFISNFKNLESMNISSNMLMDLPDSVGSLVKLKYLDLSENGFLFLPATISKLGNLEEIKFTNNFLRSLPPWLKDLSDLREINGMNNVWDKRWQDAIVGINELEIYNTLQFCRVIAKEREEAGLNADASPDMIMGMDEQAKREWIMARAMELLKSEGKKVGYMLRCIARRWPDNMEMTWAKAWLAFFMSYEKDLDGAATLANQVLDQDPGQYVAMVALGRINYGKKNKDEAEKWYRASLAIETDTTIAALAWNNLGVILDEEGKKLEARECFLKAVAANPDEKKYKDNLKG